MCYTVMLDRIFFRLISIINETNVGMYNSGWMRPCSWPEKARHSAEGDVCRHGEDRSFAQD